MKFTLRTYTDKKLQGESRHQRYETALGALGTREGDTAVILGPTFTVWFTGGRNGWVVDRKIWHPERRTA